MRPREEGLSRRELLQIVRLKPAGALHTQSPRGHRPAQMTLPHWEISYQHRQRRDEFLPGRDADAALKTAALRLNLGAQVGTAAEGARHAPSVDLPPLGILKTLSDDKYPDGIMCRAIFFGLIRTGSDTIETSDIQI